MDETRMGGGLHAVVLRWSCCTVLDSRIRHAVMREHSPVPDSGIPEADAEKTKEHQV